MAEVITYGGMYAPSAIEDMEGMAELYQAAFAELPWKERSLCPVGGDTRTCPTQFSPIEVGTECGDCHQTPTEEAYPTEDLLAKFAGGPEGTNTLWYLEKTPQGATVLATLARTTTIGGLMQFGFGDNPEMQAWLSARYSDPEEKVVWIEDVFADTRIRPRGNLRNFGEICTKLAVGTDAEKVMFQTVNPRLIRATQRDFEDRTEIADPSFEEVPGTKKFVTVHL